MGSLSTLGEREQRREALSLAIALPVALRIALGVIAAIVVWLSAPGLPWGNWIYLLHGTNGPLSVWQRFDALWYQHIELHGYAAGNSTGAFYPLYPLLARGIDFATGNLIAAELLVSSIALGAAIWALYLLVLRDFGRNTARLTVALVLTFPVAFFLSAPYTESLFLALSAGSFLGLRRHRFWLAGVYGLMASLTRAPGAILALPLAYEYWRSRRIDWRGVAVLLPLLGQPLFQLYLRLAAGESRSPIQLLQIWGYELEPPWQAIGNSIHHIGAHADWVELLNLICLIGAVVLTVWAARRLPLSYTLYLAPNLLFLLCREMWFSPLMSVSRYVLVLFPLFAAQALLFGRRRWLAVAFLVAAGCLQILVFSYWVRFGFVA